MKILKVYKQLTDVLVLEDDSGAVVLRSRLIDPGTPEEQAYIKETVGSEGFKSSLVESARAEVTAKPPEL